MKPLIGITLDCQESTEYKARVEGEGRYILWESYSNAVQAAGGSAVLLPYDSDHRSTLDRMDGLLISGGRSDIPPELSRIPDPSKAYKVSRKRTDFERAILEEALKRDMPVLGICGGMQLLAVLMGGKMIGDIPSELPDALDHQQKTPRDQPHHQVSVVTGTVLHRLVKKEELGVNSTHHQAVRDPGETIVSALAPDGVIEAVELHQKRFAIGVEWHPEIMRATVPGHEAIFEGFIEACKSN